MIWIHIYIAVFFLLFFLKAGQGLIFYKARWVRLDKGFVMIQDKVLQDRMLFLRPNSNSTEQKMVYMVGKREIKEGKQANLGFLRNTTWNQGTFCSIFITEPKRVNNLSGVGITRGGKWLRTPENYSKSRALLFHSRILWECKKKISFELHLFNKGRSKNLPFPALPPPLTRCLHKIVYQWHTTITDWHRIEWLYTYTLASDYFPSKIKLLHL